MKTLFCILMSLNAQAANTFISSGVASIAHSNPRDLAILEMGKNANSECPQNESAYLVGEIKTFDVGTFIAVRAYFKCLK